MAVGAKEISDAKLRLMDVLWDKGADTVGEVAQALPQELDLAYNTVLTALRIPEEKGHVRHTGTQSPYDKDRLRKEITKVFG